MPDRLRIFVGFHRAYWNDFEGSEFEFAVDAKGDRVNRGIGRVATTPRRAAAHGTGTMKNLNILARKPVFVKIERKAAENQHQCQQHPVFFAHRVRVDVRDKQIIRFARAKKENWTS